MSRKRAIWLILGLGVLAIWGWAVVAFPPIPPGAYSFTVTRAGETAVRGPYGTLIACEVAWREASAARAGQERANLEGAMVRVDGGWIVGKRPDALRIWIGDCLRR